jgi:hypothetical protein
MENALLTRNVAAYNRQVDIALEPTGRESAEAFPNDASDARILWQRAQPSLREVELAATPPTSAEPLHARLEHN